MFDAVGGGEGGVATAVTSWAAAVDRCAIRTRVCGRAICVGGCRSGGHIVVGHIYARTKELRSVWECSTSDSIDRAAEYDVVVWCN